MWHIIDTMYLFISLLPLYLYVKATAYFQVVDIFIYPWKILWVLHDMTLTALTVKGNFYMSVDVQGYVQLGTESGQ